MSGFIDKLCILTKSEGSYQNPSTETRQSEDNLGNILWESTTRKDNVDYTLQVGNNGNKSH